MPEPGAPISDERQAALGMVTGREPPSGRSPLGRLMPWHLLFGPTFQREMRVAGRKRGTYAFRAIYILLALGLIALVYFGLTEDIAGRPVVSQVQAYQAIAPAVALAVVWFQFSILSMLAPSLTAGAVCDEKRARTLPALMTTPLSAGEIVTGKLSARLVLIIVLTASAAPILLSVRVFGGLDVESVGLALGIGVANAALGAALGLVLSVSASRASRASNSAFGALALVNLAPVLLFVGLRRLGEQVDPDYFLPLSAPATLVSLSGVIQGGGSASADQVRYAWINIGFTLVLTVLAVAWATFRLRAVMRKEGVIQTDETGGKRRGWLARLWFGLWRGLVTKRGEPRPRVTSRSVSSRPVLWRELRVRAFKSWPQLALVTVVVAAVVAYVYYRAGLYAPEAHAVFAVIFVLMAVASAVFAATGAIPGEREADNWETLLTTPASPRTILYGKQLGAMRRQWFAPAMLGLTLIGAGVIPGAMRPTAVLQLAMIVVGAMWMLTATGLIFGLWAKRNATANALNLLFAVGLWIGLPILLGIANVVVGDRDRFIDRAIDRMQDVLISGMNPIVQTGGIVQMSAARGSSGQWPTVTSYTLLGTQQTLTLWEFTAMLAGVMGVFVLVGVGAIEFAIWRFNRITGRTS